MVLEDFKLTLIQSDLFVGLSVGFGRGVFAQGLSLLEKSRALRRDVFGQEDFPRKPLDGLDGVAHLVEGKENRSEIDHCIERRLGKLVDCLKLLSLLFSDEVFADERNHSLFLSELFEDFSDLEGVGDGVDALLEEVVFTEAFEDQVLVEEVVFFKTLQLAVFPLQVDFMQFRLRRTTRAIVEVPRIGANRPPFGVLLLFLDFLLFFVCVLLVLLLTSIIPCLNSSLTTLIELAILLQHGEKLLAPLRHPFLRN